MLPLGVLRGGGEQGRGRSVLSAGGRDEHRPEPGVGRVEQHVAVESTRCTGSTGGNGSARHTGSTGSTDRTGAARSGPGRSARAEEREQQSHGVDH
ncbi:hypothetical protein GCM10018783_70750 [Streptomyces griseosporeus]|nr:hypothetical protein GCM10018783_70750 [Streptomyces griseosporeus]